MRNFTQSKSALLGLVRQINKYLIEYNFFIAFCSLAFLFYFSLLMRFPYPLEMYIFTFGSTLATYNLFREYATIRDFLADYTSLRFFIISIGFLACLACFFMLPAAIQVFYLLLGFLTMLYKFNLFGINNLRSIPFLKLPVITIVWVLSGSIFLLVNITSDTDVQRVAGLLAMQFSFLIAIAIPFDVFGLIEDEMPTLPGKLGVQKALLISKCSLAVYCIAAVLIHQKTEFLYASALVGILTFLAIHFSPNLKKKALQYYLLDGTIILQTVVFYLFLG